MFASKRMGAGALLASLQSTRRELLGVEERNKKEAERSREDAKASIRLGDSRGYRRAALRCCLAQHQAQIAAGMVETVQGLEGAMEARRGLDRLVGIGDRLRAAEQALGVDDDRLGRVLAHLRAGIETVNRAAVSVTQSLRSIAWGEAAQSDLDALHDELLAEIEHETTLSRRVKDELRAGGKPLGPH